MIDSFTGEYQWLSNFEPCTIIYGGMYYPSTEAAYQAAKTIITNERKPFQIMTPVQAKRSGKKVTLRADWKDVKVDIMHELCEQKFNLPEFKNKLIATGNQDIIEGNYWGDVFWGVCKGHGKNYLGRIIMHIRNEMTS